VNLLDYSGFEPGDRVGRYRVEELIARGGMSAIYRATEPQLGRTVALKILAETFAQDPTTRARFMNEWRAAASLNHPNILPVYEAGEVGERLFIAMELIEGTDLAHRLTSEGALPPAVVVGILEQIAAALDAAHAAGLVHRDVKPGNILLAGDRAWLTDFGLSKLLGAGQELTMPGRMVGTIEYLSPEQIRGASVTARTDVYGLGCVIFEALTGAAPFVGADFVVMRAHLHDPAPLMVTIRRGLPAAADNVVRKAMNKRPDQRFESAGATIEALKAAFGYE
jgi:serine/threonine-protein kinase